MNTVYKVIWSKIKNCYVVVSELAKRSGKGGPARCHGSAGSVFTAVLLASLLNMGIAAPVWAENSAAVTGAAGTAGSEDTLATIQGGEGILVTADPEDGKTITIAADRTLALLNRYMVFSSDYGGSTTDNPVVDSRSKSSFALGQNSQINVVPGENVTSSNNMAIGSKSRIYAAKNGSNTAIGANSVTGGSLPDDSEKIIYTALSTAIGADSRVFGNQSVSIGQNAQVGNKTEIILTKEGDPVLKLKRKTTTACRILYNSARCSF